ncbi:MAG: AAA family ATPase [Corynebacterium sp.]|nr:AAA family ATPase [Corynebacterium sp.]
MDFPFVAVRGQDNLKLALILSAINPRIGGVVIRGEKGTAKTTTVRAFAHIISGPLVNLPLGATEDRVVGSIDMETILTTGKATYKPGLLADANNGILYVDEINLLPDHLVDSLLDASATGRTRIERDGISYESPSNFVLVGTMNPEEGELRPQLLDRCGLAVDVAASREPQLRAEIIRTRLAFEEDPEAFVANYTKAEEELAARIVAAKEALSSVELSDDAVLHIAELCAAMDVDGMRADLVIARAATAHAAWSGKSSVEEEDIRIAAALALPHRAHRNPFDQPEETEQRINEALDNTFNQEEQPSEEPSGQEPGDSDTTQDPATGQAPEGVARMGARFPGTRN